MAHIPDGVLSLPVLAGGAALAAGALGLALRRLDDEALPRTAVISAMFFVASLVTIPVGPTSVHLLLSGLMGLVLGWAAVPAVMVALILQSVFFGVGGVAALGVNTVNIALPGVIWAALLAPVLRRARRPSSLALIGGAVALLSVATTAVGVMLVLAASDPAYLASAPLVLATYLPLGFAEAVVTGFATAFLARVRPDVLRPLQPAPRHA